MLRLSRLSRTERIHVRFTTPGHANPYFIDRARLVDPAHPAAKLALSKLPAAVAPQFSIRAFPNALLQKPVDFIPINPLLATDLVRAHPRLGVEAHRRHNVSLLFHISKKATNKLSVVRRRLRSKMKTAITLVLGRNADAVAAPETCQPNGPYPSLNLVCHPRSERERFLPQGWTLLVIPALAIYKMPLPNLVQAVRKALLSLGQKSTSLEASWSAPPKRRIPPQVIHESNVVCMKRAARKSAVVINKIC